MPSYNGGVKASKAAVREAATVMLVRDAPELEVFMLRRNPESVFAGGAYVFPGGAVDADDRVLGEDRRFWVAAVRETFEEAGVLVKEALDLGGEDTLVVAPGLVPFDVRQAQLDQHTADVLVLELDRPF